MLGVQKSLEAWKSLRGRRRSDGRSDVYFMQFIFNLTFREIRSSWRRLLFFFLCIAIGVGSVVALRSLIQNLANAVGTDARALLTADFEVSTTATFSPDDISRIESVISKSQIIEARNEAVTTVAMSKPSDSTKEGLQFVEIKGIEPPFPLVGEFKFSDGKSFDFKSLDNNGIVVAPLLLEKLDLKIGDKLKIGETDFEIRATFDEEPGGQSGFRLGPRVFMQKKAFEETGLNRSNSRVRRRILYRTSENPTELVKQLRKAFEGTILTVQSYRETQENISEQFTQNRKLSFFNRTFNPGFRRSRRLECCESFCRTKTQNCGSFEVFGSR